MSGARGWIALWFVVAALPAFGPARSDETAPCPCDGDAPFAARSNLYRTDGWLPGPDGCARIWPTYESPRGPWYIVTDAVALKREADGDQSFATLNNPDDVVLSTADLKFEFQGGLRVTIGNQFSEWYAVEAGYVGLMTWDEARAVRDTTLNAQGTLGNLFSPFTDFGNPAQVGLDFNNFASIRTVSTLDSAEINLRQRLDTVPSIMQASMLYGLRYVSVRERFEYRTESASPAPVGAANAVDVETGNDLFGFQLGGMLEFYVAPRTWIHVEGKAVVCHNSAEKDTRYTVGPLAGPGTTVAGARDEDRTAFLGDVAVAVMYQFTPRLVGRVGYQAMWLDGLALASENFERNIALVSLGPAQLVHDGNLVYHGPYAGILWTW